MMRNLCTLFLAILIISSCGSDDNELNIEGEIADIESYAARNNLNTQVTDSGMHYEITDAQNGIQTDLGILAIFNFKQFLMDGTIIIETEANTPAAAIPRQLVPGLMEAFSLLRKGDTGVFLMPSSIAFGSSGGNGVDPNSPVGFEITLLDCHADLLSYEVSQIQAYLGDNNLSASATPSGLHYIIQEAGEGEHPSANAVVSVNYRGFLLDGTVFDESTGTPLTISLAQVVDGWKEGIPLFKKGGKGMLFIPSSLAYGQSGSGPIPGNTPIAFEIELVDFQ